MPVRPVAILISDIHFNLSTLPLAAKSLRMAILRARSLGVRLIVCGDTNDSKAILRGEVANTLIAIMKEAGDFASSIYFLVGNHDRLNERAEEHSLNFLRPYATVVDTPTSLHGFNFIPYQSSGEAFLEAIKRFKKGSLVIAHQGFLGASMGEYVTDKTSVDPAKVKDWTVVTGHYHRHQTIGTVTYIGSPYTITFAEAGDGPKGFQILYADNLLELVPLRLRKHITVERDVADVFEPIHNLDSEDLLWLKVRGPASALDAIDKKKLGAALLGHQNFKLDKIYNDSVALVGKEAELSHEDTLDLLIDMLDESAELRTALKTLWRDICS